jgi:hypothetical protein
MAWGLAETSWALKNLLPGLPSAFLAPFSAPSPYQSLEAALRAEPTLAALDGLWIPHHLITDQFEKPLA